MRTLPISCWAAEDIPSNKADKLGYSYLTNAELLSIIIGSGTQDCNAVELARNILDSCGNNLNSLARLPKDIYKMRGLGRIKLARIMAALELGNRREKEDYQVRPDLGTATRIYNHYKHLADGEVEEFWVSLCDQHYNLIKDVRIGVGGLTEVSVDLRIIMREAVINNATTIACVHNHPSGSISPSKCDDTITNDIKRASQIMRLHLIDHVIIGQGCYYSYHEQGLI